MAGFAIIPDIEDPELTGVDIALWTALCRRSQWEHDDNGMPSHSKEGSCFPSLQDLMDRSRLGKSTVCRSLNKLERLGYVVKTQQKINNSFTATCYMLYAEDHRRGLSHSGTGCPTQGQGGCPTAGQVVPERDKGCPTQGQGLSQSGTGVVPQRDYNRIYNKTNKIKKNREITNTTESNITDGETTEAARQAFLPVARMYPLCPEYVPDAEKEFELIRELAQAYPRVSLTEAFQTALDRLRNAGPGEIPRNLLDFLREQVAGIASKAACPEKEAGPPEQISPTTPPERHQTNGESKRILQYPVGDLMPLSVRSERAKKHKHSKHKKNKKSRKGKR